VLDNVAVDERQKLALLEDAQIGLRGAQRQIFGDVDRAQPRRIGRGKRRKHLVACDVEIEQQLAQTHRAIQTRRRIGAAIVKIEIRRVISGGRGLPSRQGQIDLRSKAGARALHAGTRLIDTRQGKRNFRMHGRRACHHIGKRHVRSLAPIGGDRDIAIELPRGRQGNVAVKPIGASQFNATALINLTIARQLWRSDRGILDRWIERQRRVTGPQFQLIGVGHR
jgi:hypothetical protein